MQTLAPCNPYMHQFCAVERTGAKMHRFLCSGTVGETEGRGGGGGGEEERRRRRRRTRTAQSTSTGWFAWVFP